MTVTKLRETWWHRGDEYEAEGDYFDEEVEIISVKINGVEFKGDLDADTEEEVYSMLFNARWEGHE